MAIIDANDPEDRLKLAYGISHSENLFDYVYAKQHMNQDLPSELIKPELLQIEVTRFNSEVDDYFDNKLLEIIINTLSSKLSDVNIINSVDTLPDNTISYYYLRQKLNKYWAEKQDFEVRCNDGLCKLNNHIDIANIPVLFKRI